MTIGCNREIIVQGHCRSLDADVTIGCYYGGCSSCDNTIPRAFVFGTNFVSLALVRLIF